MVSETHTWKQSRNSLTCDWKLKHIKMQIPFFYEIIKFIYEYAGKTRCWCKANRGSRFGGLGSNHREEAPLIWSPEVPVNCCVSYVPSLSRVVFLVKPLSFLHVLKIMYFVMGLAFIGFSFRKWEHQAKNSCIWTNVEWFWLLAFFFCELNLDL